MKNLLIAIALLASLNAMAQKNDVITTDTSKAKMAIFNQTVYWVEKTWGTTDNVIDQKDEATGTILIKGGLKAVPKADGYSVKGLTLTELKITIEQGSIKLDFAHTTFKWDAGTAWNFEDNDGGSQKEKWKAEVLNEMTGLIADYRSMLKKNNF